MCGIVGALAFGQSSFKITNEYIIAMRDTMNHRGPDGGGVWIASDCSIGFGHRRLSIIDMSGSAAQPMSNYNDTLWITFNGEIYNHADIRKELESKKKYKWKTDHSDTEVILHAFEEWGISCVHRFRGMFAFGLWDSINEELWLVRDRIGIKPLYYSIHNSRLTFASEIKALLKDPDQKRSINEQALFHYLSFLTSPPPFTLFQGINKLEAGSYLRIKTDGSIIQSKYWDVLDHTVSTGTLSEAAISENILEELRTSVKLRKVSDVPVGVFLSGGIDSSTNVALFSINEKSEIKTFTIGYHGAYDTSKNETTYARSMADITGAKYHEHLLSSKDLIDFLPLMIRLQDEPIADPVCVPLYYVSKLARTNGVIVCQLGEGADELFFGYPEWKRILLLESVVRPLPRFLKKTLMILLRMVNKKYSLYYERIRRSYENLPMFWSGAEVFTESKKDHILSRRLREKFKGYSSWEAIKGIHNSFLSKTNDRSDYKWMTYMDLNLRLPELLLMRVDKMSMGVSLEGRVPFLDHKFVEYAMSIPDSIKLKHGTLKYVLKKAVQGIIPDEVINRKKQGFSVPIFEWFFEELGDRARTELSDFCDCTDLFNKNAIMNLFKEGRANEIWCILNLALWWKEYIGVEKRNEF